MKNYFLTVFLLIIALILVFCCSNKNNADSTQSDNTKVYKYLDKNLSSKCKATVKDFEGDEIELMGYLVVIGNEPFTRLEFQSEKEIIKEDNKDTYTKENDDLFRIVDACSKELWDYQGVKIKVKAKFDVKYLETVLKQKLKIQILYPLLIEKLDH